MEADKESSSFIFDRMAEVLRTCAEHGLDPDTIADGVLVFGLVYSFARAGDPEALDDSINQLKREIYMDAKTGTIHMRRRNTISH